ncbi:MAG TPA: hypothetical protein VMD77_13330 [Candidatus Baltobacteraceae bacterium]|nr:hypothetical protein [Candidatus Baltobacteraceae bacterium]
MPRIEHGLLDFPLGTALGVYTLFVLLPDAAGDEYRQMSKDARSALVKPAAS